ncbi:MAG: glycosyl transferase [Bacteroides oleiciplenus]|nr:MAG: glycosyl transferase [Bacteroides oleiciplenus]
MKLSIITINYNNAIGLKKTIESIVEQTYHEFEYIVIDGGSNDDSKKVILENQNNISDWCSEKDAGIYNAMNKGILKATGEYLLFLNSGDYLHDTTVLEEIVTTLSGEDIIYGDLLYIENGVKKDTCVYPSVLDLDYFLEYSLGHPASFIKKSLFQNSLYSETLKIVSDWEFFLKKIVLESVSYKHIDRVITDFDMGGISSQSIDLCNEEREWVMHKYFPGMLYDTLQSAAKMRKQPLYKLFCEISATHRFQYRIKPIINFLFRLNQCFSK